MSRSPQRLPDYLGHISQAIERIQRYTDQMSEIAFLQSEMAQDAVIRNLEIIGEASRNIASVDPDFVSANPDVPLNFAYEMRNALSHGYFQVDLSVVWKMIERDLPTLKQQIHALLAGISNATDIGI
ncbi:HepT-like ribonuclease domain-containing protein [Beijerinckia indica]|uniref:DUF86 domain-containing protein n=1 Tax=Beijerinckia indica subsp. indica (strain ATCC 9039 / DSM 1715 / NCIMB 8712) TaxID=395963 RepID=B2IC29_BEII9|nr:DUF86 domain-containing protein [Beijerinckia indica]ACB95284.1 protein of unknown function DUF86 [Beijerinckia indica subsp. indica ATCC 9039]